MKDTRTKSHFDRYSLKALALSLALSLVLTLTNSPSYADSDDSDAPESFGLADRVGPPKGPRKTVANKKILRK